jgi:hypothetical protein
MTAPEIESGENQMTLLPTGSYKKHSMIRLMRY